MDYHAPWLPALRRSEWVLFLFFLYVPALALWRTHAFLHPSELALIIPLTLLALARADSISSGPRWAIVRDWVPAGLVLVAYWSIDWVATPPAGHQLEYTLIRWDRTLLNNWGLRAAIEYFGPLLPSIFDLAYLLLYAVPPLAIASFYFRRERERIDEFLCPFLLGTLITYALLPHFPSDPPRLVFAGQDLPTVETTFRRLNLWILDHWDIHSSVFPSGHVAVGFSAAFAMRLAAPRNHGITRTLLVLAVLVWINTIYGRYHYAADGLAGIAVSVVAISLLVFASAYVAMRHRERDVPILSNRFSNTSASNQ